MLEVVILVDASVLRVVRSFLALFKLNRELLNNPYWFLPVLDDGHPSYVQVGRNPQVVQKFCGRFRSWLECRDKDSHKGIVYKSQNFTDKNVVCATHYWCKNWHCPRCFLHGACVVGARRIEARLKAFVDMGLGNPEHIVFSVPDNLQDKSMDTLFKLAWAVARDRGVSGVDLFHGRFINVPLGGLGWRAHFHCLGFVDGGFDRCRSCVHKRADCEVCNGFKGRELRGFKRDGWIVKVEDERKTLFGTAWYQLNHHTVKLGLVKSHSVRWFGKCGNRMLKHGYDSPSKAVPCPVCEVAGHSDSLMSESKFWGKLPKDVSDPNYRRVYSVPDLDDDGLPNFSDDAEGVTDDYKRANDHGDPNFRRKV